MLAGRIVRTREESPEGYPNRQAPDNNMRYHLPLPELLFVPIVSNHQHIRNGEYAVPENGHQDTENTQETLNVASGGVTGCPPDDVLVELRSGQSSHYGKDGKAKYSHRDVDQDARHHGLSARSIVQDRFVSDDKGTQ